MSKRRKDINLRGNRLNPRAVKLANQELLKNNPQLFDYTNKKMRKLTLEWCDTLYRKEWMDLYVKYSNYQANKPVVQQVPEGMLQADVKWNRVIATIKTRWWSTPKKCTFAEAVAELEKCYQIIDVAIDTHKKINKDQWIVSYFSELFGGVNLDWIIEWSRLGKGNLKICRKALSYSITEDHHIEVGKRCLKEAEKDLNKIDRMLVKYRTGVESGAEKSIMGIEITITVLSTLVGAGGVGLAGNALANSRKLKLAVDLAKNRRVIAFLTKSDKVNKVLAGAGKIMAEGVATNTVATSAELVSLYRSNKRIDWGKIISKSLTGFVKDFVSGGLEQIFLLKIVKPKFLAKIPTKSAFLQRYGIDLSKEAISTWDYFIKTLNAMSIESIYQAIMAKVNAKKKGKKMTFNEYMENMATELLKFNLGTVAKASRGL